MTRLPLLEDGPPITGQLAANLRLYGFRPSRPRPNNIWVRGRRSSGRRVVAIYSPDGTLLLHRESRRGPFVAQIDDADDAGTITIGTGLRQVLRA